MPEPKQFLFREDLIRLLPVGARIAELGVQYGYFSAIIHYINHPKELVLVDAWRHFPGPYRGQGNVGDEEQEKIRQFVTDKFLPYPNVRVVHSMTHDAATLFPDGHFDCVYIDASHFLEDIRQDLIDWYPKVKSGGLFCGHDYWQVNVPYIQVKEAVDEFCVQNGLNLDYITLGHCGSWGLWKP